MRKHLVTFAVCAVTALALCQQTIVPASQLSTLDDARKQTNLAAVTGITGTKVDLQLGPVPIEEVTEISQLVDNALRDARLSKLVDPPPSTTPVAVPVPTPTQVPLQPGIPGQAVVPPTPPPPLPVLRVTVWKVEGSVSYSVLVRLYDHVTLARNSKDIEVATWVPIIRERTPRQISSIWGVRDEIAAQLASFVSDVSSARNLK